MGFCFTILDMRICEIDLHKVSSHIEGVGARAVLEGFAELVDIIGNCLADEVAELAVKLLRPPQADIEEAKRMDDMAFLVCIRLGMIQARKWELFNGAPIYEAPNMAPEPPTSYEEALKALITQMQTSGHIVEKATCGKFQGLKCARCGIFHKDSEFGKWRKKCAPKPISRQLVQHQQARKTAAQTASMEENIKRAKADSAKLDTESNAYPQILNSNRRG